METILEKFSAHKTRYRIAGVSFLLLLLLLQMAGSSAQKSAAFDETYHLISGYAYLHTGDARLSWEHPPVPQVLAALPLHLRDDMAPFPIEHPGWQDGDAEAFVDDYLWVDNAARAPELIWAGRWPLMLLTLGFGLALFVGLYKLCGETAAWVALGLFVLDPNIIANGRMIGNDLAVAGFMFIATWRLGAYLKHPSARNLILTGVATGLAVGSKLTAVLLGPAFSVIALLYPAPQDNQLNFTARTLRRLLALSAMALVCGITLWAIFGFEVGPIVDGGIPLPAPTYLRGLPRMFQRVARGTPTFLLGEVSDTGWWYYFLVTFALKTPLPTLILILLSFFSLRQHWRESVLWWAPLSIYALIASGSTLQIGYRYILPVLIFGIALAASQFRDWPKAKWQHAALGLLYGWLLLNAAWSYPHHLAFANAIAGGPRQSWRHFADMNVDWGMDLVALQEYIAAHPDEEVSLAYFGSAYPSAYGIHARMLPSFSRLLAGTEFNAFNPYSPPPGTYAISVTSLHLGLLYEGQDLYAYFRDLQPTARAGHSILIYHVSYPDDLPIQRSVVTGSPVWQHPPESLGWKSDQRLITKWAGPGAMVLPANGPAHFVIQTQIPDLDFVRAAIAAGDARPYLDVQTASTTVTTPQGDNLPLPVTFEDGPEFIGWQRGDGQMHPGSSLQLTSYWRIAQPLEPPLAIFVHLIDEDGNVITQWDGWPVATHGLEKGDLLLIEHPLLIPANAQPAIYTLQLGIYRPPAGPRLIVSESDRLYLEEIQLSPP